LLLSLVVLLLVRLERGRDGGRPILLATLLAWAYYVRPLSLIALVCVGAYLALFHRRLLVPFGVTVAGWVALFVAASYAIYGTAVPPYYRTGEFSVATLPTGLAANLFSPSRGLLVFTPALLWIAYLLARYRAHLAVPRLVGLSLLITGLHLIAVSSFRIWWAGYSYGPWYTSDVLPWLALLAILGVAAWCAALERAVGGRLVGLRRAEVALGALLAAMSILVNAPGALSPATANWNVEVDVDQHPERVWDWFRPQFLAGVVGGQRSSR
jgi:hypothetical protein